MTQTYNPRSQCLGKVQYPNRRAARRAARQVESRDPGQGRLDLYQCPHCAWWHFGHNPRTRRQPDS